MTRKEAYRRRVALGLCVRCGRPVAEIEYVHCKACRELRAKQIAEARNIKALEPRPVSRSFGYSITEVVQMAEARGISYGKMVAILDGKMPDVKKIVGGANNGPDL